MVTEVFEDHISRRIEYQKKQEEKEKREELKQDFFNLPEIGDLIIKLEDLVQPDEKTKIENRLLLKYEKDTDNFNLPDSLHKVLLGEKIGGYQTTGILLEGENGKPLTRKEKEKLYTELLEKNEINKGNKEIPEGAERIYKNTNEKVSTILDNSQENQETNNEKIDKRLFYTPLNPLIEGLKENGYIEENVKIEGNDKDKKNIIKKNIKGNKELEKNINDYFDQKTTVTESTFKKSDFYKEAESFNFLNPEVNGLDLLLAENYISIPNKESGEKDIEKDLNRTMDIALNKILKVNSKEFTEVNIDLITEIHETTDIKNKYKLLQDIHELDIKSDAKFFSKNAKLRKKKIEQKLENIKIKIGKEGNLENKEKLIKEKKNLEIQLKDTIKEIEKLPTEGDVKMGGGKNEPINSNIETTKQ